MLTARRESVLTAIVEGHIDTVTPVGSQHIAEKWGKALSPATVRSEMATLEQDGYITRPHASAGGLPTDLGYRTYIRQFLANPVLGPREKGHIKRRLVHVAMDQEGWARSAAEALSRLTGSLAVTTAPKPSRVRLKRIELVPVQDLMVMTLVVLWGAKILRQMISLEQDVPRNELTRVSNKLNHLFEGVAPSAIGNTDLELSPLEENVVRLVKGLMEEEEQRDLEDPLFEGLQQIFEQPELAEAEILRDMMEILEERGRLKNIMEQVLLGAGDPGGHWRRSEGLQDAPLQSYRIRIWRCGRHKGRDRGVWSQADGLPAQHSRSKLSCTSDERLHTGELPPLIQP